MENKNKLINSALSDLIKDTATKSGKDLALPVDLETKWDKDSNVSLHDLKNIWQESGLLTSSQVLGTLHEAIIMNDDPTSNSIDAEQAQMIDQVSREYSHVDHELFWDEADIFDDEASPLSNGELADSLNHYLNGFSEAD